MLGNQAGVALGEDSIAWHGIVITFKHTYFILHIRTKITIQKVQF